MSDKQTIIPNLFIAGAPKAGTTAFVSGLYQHPDIFVGKKEPRYFDASVYYDFSADYPLSNCESYLSLYASNEAKEAKYRVDASVFIMYSPSGIRKILELSPQAKFIIILRDPFRAALSMHAQRLKYTNTRMRELSSDFLDCWDLIEKRHKNEGFPKGCRNRNLFRYDFLYDYRPHIDNLEAIVPTGQLLFIDYEVFKKRPQDVYTYIFDYLKIQPTCVKTEIVNARYAVKKSLKNMAIDVLRNTFTKLPFRPKRLVFVVKRLLEKAMDKEKADKRYDEQSLQEVETYFKPSKERMLEVVRNINEVNKNSV